MTTKKISSRLRHCLKWLVRGATGRRAVSLLPGVSLTELGEPGEEVFFGYYDVTPFGPDDRSVLAMRRPVSATGRVAGTPIELGIYELSQRSPEFRRFGTSTSWCWQQGCRLQWWRGGHDGHVIYNRTAAGRHRSIIQNVDSGKVVADFDRAVYSVAGDGDRAISLNFARLQRMRPGYGYDDLDDPFEDDASPHSDGIWLLDLRDGASRLLLSLAEIAAFQPESSMQGAKHYFNHLLWSPGGSRFFFLHLWQAPGGKRHSRAFVWEAARGEYRFLGAKDHFSHHWWIDEDRLVAYSTHGDTGRHYHLYDIAGGTRQVLGPNLLVEDGHPSTSPVNASLMLTDTYPDRFLDQHLLLYDMKDESLLRVGRFYSPPRFSGEGRCDLHPRWSRQGKLACLDSAHRGIRRLCVVDMEELLSAKGSLR